MKNVIVLFLLISMLVFSGCDTTYTEIEMPHDSSYYDEYDGTVEDLVKHFEDLGFTDIEIISSSYSGYASDPIDFVSAEGHWSGGFKEGDIRYSYDTIKIHCYDECSNLTVDTCPDLAEILIDKNANYEYFAEKYEGEYFEFECYIVSNLTSTETEVDYLVVGGEYFEGIDSGLSIYLIQHNSFADNSPDISIDTSVQTGDKVKVIGKVNSLDSDFYNYLSLHVFYVGLLE